MGCETLKLPYLIEILGNSVGTLKCQDGYEKKEDKKFRKILFFNLQFCPENWSSLKFQNFLTTPTRRGQTKQSSRLKILTISHNLHVYSKPSLVQTETNHKAQPHSNRPEWAALKLSQGVGSCPTSRLHTAAVATGRPSFQRKTEALSFLLLYTQFSP